MATTRSTAPPPAIALDAATARRIALAAQGFAARRGSAPSRWPVIAATIDRLGLLQIDSVNVLVRAHYLPVFSRIGAYDTAAFERRAFSRRHRTLFEYWAHEASLLPLAFHPLMRWRMARAAAGEGIYGALARFARDNPAYVAAVRSEVAARGPVGAGALSDPGERGGSWWGWHKGKIALEYLFWAGEITTAERRGFERLYDLTERVIPADILAMPTPPEADAVRALVAFAGRALGVAAETDLRDYFRLPVAAARQAIGELVEEGVLVPVAVAGWKPQAYVAAGLPEPGDPKPTALLSPFDPLVWNRGRTERLFDFHYRIEIYTPQHKRVFGYYVLPFLHRGRLRARVDLKADRAAGLLRVLGAHPEPGGRSAATASALAAELRRLADWLGLAGISVTAGGDFAAAVRAALET